MGPKKIVKRVVVVRRKVVSAAKPAEPVVKKLGVLDDLKPLGEATDAPAAAADSSSKKRRREASSGSSADGSDDASSDEEVERAAQRRRKMVNEDMLGRFQSKQSNNFVEADVPEAREVPLISDDMRAALKKRRTEHRAPALVETPDVAAPPAAASFVELASPTPSEAAVSSPFGAGDMISFDAADDDGAARVGDHAVPMWCTRRYTHHNRMVRLHDEAVDLVRYLRPTHEEEVMRKKVVVDVTHIAAMLFPGCRVVTFGSLVTGLVLPTSDVDLTITLEMEGKEELHAAMDKLATYIQGQGLCDEAYPQVIKQTKVPLVKFTHKETWIDVDISFNAPNGRVNSEMVVQYCNRLPVVFPLVTLIKYFLQQRSMHEPFTGGLGSYAVSLLVVAFLQHHPAFQMGADASKAGLGGLLMDFFWFYGSVFSFRDAVIAVGDTNLRRKTRPEAGDRASCFLLDPQNVQNNVASSTRQLEPIRSAFHHAFLALSSDQFPAVPEGEKSAEHPHIQNRPTLLSRVIHIDHAMVDRRKKVTEAYDSWVDKNPTMSSQDILTEFEEVHVSGPEIKAYVRALLKEYGLQEPDSSVFHGVGVKSGGRGAGSPVPPASILAAASSTVHSFSDANDGTAAEDRSAENDTGAEVYSL